MLGLCMIHMWVVLSYLEEYIHFHYVKLTSCCNPISWSVWRTNCIRGTHRYISSYSYGAFTWVDMLTYKVVVHIDDFMCLIYEPLSFFFSFFGLASLHADTLFSNFSKCHIKTQSTTCYWTLIASMEFRLPYNPSSSMSLVSLQLSKLLEM